MFEPFEIKLLKVAGSLWLKIVGTVVLGSLCGCVVQSSAASVRTLEPASVGFSFEAPLKPIPETQEPPPAAPVERPDSKPASHTAADPAPGVAPPQEDEIKITVVPKIVPPLIVVYGPPGCVPCVKAVKEMVASKRYNAAKFEDIPESIEDLVESTPGGGYPFVVFWDGNNRQRRVWPYVGFKDFEARYNETMKRTAKPKRVPKTQAPMKERAATGSQDAAPPNVAAQPSAEDFVNKWGLRKHLVETHGYSQSQVNGMTAQQCIDAHNAAHSQKAEVWNGFFGMRRERLARRGKL